MDRPQALWRSNPPVLKITRSVLTGYENLYFNDSSRSYQTNVLSRSVRSGRALHITVTFLSQQPPGRRDLDLHGRDVIGLTAMRRHARPALIPQWDTEDHRL